MELIKIKLLNFELRLARLIDSIRLYGQNKKRRRDLEEIRRYRDIANDARSLGQNYIADYYEKRAKIIEDTMEK